MMKNKCERNKMIKTGDERRMEKKAKILIIEDDEEISRELGEYLSRAGYDTVCIRQFSDVAKKALKEAPDLILLDVNLPGIDGLHICEQIRKTSQIPIIFVTGNNTSMDELNCMLRGGDDYVAKPYQLPVLMARIAAVLRRTMRTVETENPRPEYKGVSLDLAAAQIWKEGRKQELTKNEVKILHCLFEHPGEVVAREDILDYLWDHDVFIDDNTLSVHITRIRNKLKEIGAPDFIETKRGLGYRI